LSVSRFRAPLPSGVPHDPGAAAAISAKPQRSLRQQRSSGGKAAMISGKAAAISGKAAAISGSRSDPAKPQRSQAAAAIQAKPQRSHVP
jgi:hypothetical protein